MTVNRGMEKEPELVAGSLTRRQFIGAAGAAAMSLAAAAGKKKGGKKKGAPAVARGETLNNMNVIVIIADSLRVDHVGCYGSKIKTPNLDRFAAESAVFDEAYAENLPTMPSRTAMWTGRFLFWQRGWQPLAMNDYPMAEIFWDRGMTSAYITDVYHMHKPIYNCGRGFDTTVFIRGQEYDPWIVDPAIKVDINRYHRLPGDNRDEMWRQRYEQYLRNVSGFKTEEDYFAPRVAKEAIRWLEYVTKTKKDSLFLWADFFDPHEPWDPPSPFREMYDPGYTGLEMIDPVPGEWKGYMTEAELKHTRALYAGEVTFVDKWIGILLDRIREIGLWDNSLIVFTSDHGEPLGEHGYVRKAFPRNYEELAHVPLMVRHPKGVGAGKRFPAFVQPPDMLPTILELKGIPKEGLRLDYRAPVNLTFPQDIVVQSENVRLTGQTFLPILEGRADSIRDFAVTAHHNAQWSIRTKEWAYLYNLNKKQPNELYDRIRDRAETKNVISEQKDVADALEKSLLEFAKSLA